MIILLVINTLIAIYSNKKAVHKHRFEGVQKSTPSRQNQDFDEVDRRINRRIPSAQSALKPAVFLAGSQFRLRIKKGKLFVSLYPSAVLKILKIGFLTV